MHPNPAFRQVSEETSLNLARERGFGMLTINGDPVPLCSHIPFLLAHDGKLAEAHLVRSNPIARRLVHGPVSALLVVTGPEGYISPDWYGAENQVPTWNYVAVHLIGQLRAKPARDLRDHLDRLTAFFETRLLPKPVWLAEKTDADVLKRLMQMIVPVEFSVMKLKATWKLSQNKDMAARKAAADMVADRDLADLMRAPPD